MFICHKIHCGKSQLSPLLPSMSDFTGNYIRISSENNITTLYAHNQFLFVKEGDSVLAGQIIATMGDTGYATGPHLHFEFIVDGIRYNPVYAIEL